MARCYSILLMLASAILLSCNSTKVKNSAAATSSTDKNKTTQTEPNVRIGQAPDTITTRSGLRYVILRHKGGRKRAGTGYIVTVNYRGMLADGTEFDNSAKFGKPFEFEIGYGKVIKGWDEGISLLYEGDSALLIIPPSLGFGSKERKGVPANSTLYYMVDILQFKEPNDVVPYFYKSRREYSTASGLKYYIVKEGTGPAAYVGATVKIQYSGFLPDGKVFDSSLYREGPQEFQLGVGAVIKGLDEGILLMHKGSKYHFVIPAELGYGDKEAGEGAVPANTELQYDCELLDVR